MKGRRRGRRKKRRMRRRKSRKRGRWKQEKEDIGKRVRELAMKY